MTKLSKERVPKLTRSATSGKFVSRGEMTRNGKAMGTASDGTVIFEPKMKPKSFSKSELRKAVEAVKSERRK